MAVSQISPRSTQRPSRINFSNWPKGLKLGQLESSLDQPFLGGPDALKGQLLIVQGALVGSPLYVIQDIV
jgi:hypothetical protein